MGPFVSAGWRLAATTAAPPESSLCNSTKRVLTAGDLTWLGLFRVPKEMSGANGTNAQGTLAARYVGGELRFFMQTSAGDGVEVIEFPFPGVAATLEAAPRAKAIRNWGDVYGGRKIGIERGPVPNLLDTGLFWDDVTQALYWLYMDQYNVISANHPVVGCARLNDATGTVQSYGPWQLTLGPHQTHRIMLRIPTDFAMRHLQGKTMALGCIGTSSGNAESSWGPVLAALQSDIGPGVPPFPDSGPIPVRKLVGYSLQNRARRDNNYISHGPTDLPGGYWTQVDGYGGTGCWIDTPELHGMVFFQMRGTGHVWYGVDFDDIHGLPDTGQPGTTGPHCTSSKPMAYVYDPADFVSVLNGSVRSYEIAPNEIDLTGRGLWRPHYQHINGSYFDSLTNRLYVTTMSVDAREQWEVYPIVNVFQVG